MNHEEFIRLMREGNEKKISTPVQQLVDYFDKEKRATERIIGNFPMKEMKFRAAEPRGIKRKETVELNPLLRLDF